jgi:Right handed beta helix region
MKLQHGRIVFGSGATFALCAWLACATYEPTVRPGDGPTSLDATPVDGGASSSGALPDASLDAATKDAAPEAEAEAPAKVIYVSAETGDDKNTGTAASTPLRSISKAIALRNLAKLADHEIHVCRGRYVEKEFALRDAVILRGGYNCVSWTRSQGFGKAGGFSSNDVSTITSEAGQAAATLSASNMPSLVLDGFSIERPNAGDTVLIDKVTSATLQDNLVRAASLRVMGPTKGIHALFSELAITDNEVHGGAGTDETNVGSFGVSAESCTGTLRRNRIYAGYPAGSVDRLLVVDSEIVGEESDGPGASLIGIYQSNGNLTVRGSSILGSPTSLRGNAIGLYGTRGALVAEGNRINPGSSSGGQFGVASNLSNTELRNNAIAAAGPAAYGMYLGAGKAVAEHNTIAAFGPGALGLYFVGEASPTALWPSAAINNVIVAMYNGIVLNMHYGSRIESFRGNRIQAVEPLLVRDLAGSDTRPPLEDGALVTNNARLPADLAGVIAPFSEADIQAAIRNPMARVVPDTTVLGCTLARGGENRLATSPTDLAGVARNARPSIGAWEVPLTSCP